MFSGFYIRQIFILLLIVPIFAFAQDSEKAVYNNITEHYQQLEDGARLYKKSAVIEVLDAGIAGNLLNPLIYNSQFQEVKIKKFEIIKRNGDTIRPYENFAGDTLFSIEHNGHNHLRKIVPDLGAIGDGDVMSYAYEILTQKGFFPFFMGSERILKEFPVKDYAYHVSFPADLTLNYKLLNSDREPEIVSKDNITTYSWRFDLSQAEEGGLFVPHPAKFEPYLIWSTENNFGRKYQRFVMQPAFNFAVDDSIIKHCRKLKQGSTDEIDFILKVQSFIFEEINTLDLPMKIAGYWFRSPVEVYYDRVGTNIEKATLMCAMLQNLGVYAVPVLVGEKEIVTSEVPNFDVFDKIFVRVFRLPKDYIYLPVDEEAVFNIKYALNGMTVVPVLPQIRHLQYVTENNPDNYLNFSGKFVLRELPNLQGNLLIEGNEVFNPYFSLRKERNINLFFLFDGIFANEADIIEYKLNEREFSFGIENSILSLSNTNNNVFLPPLSYYELVDRLVLEVMEGGNTPLRYSPSTKTYLYDIKLKDGIKTERKNINIVRENELGQVIIQYKSTKRKIHIYRRLMIKTDHIKVSQREKLRELLTLWLDDRYFELQLEND